MTLAMLHLNIFRCSVSLSVIWIYYYVSAQQLCQYGTWTDNIVNLQMDTSPIIGQHGMCSCRFTFNTAAKISLFPSSVNSPNCLTNIELVDTFYTFECKNGKFPSSYFRNHNSGDILWLIVTTTVNITQSLSGNLQIKSEGGSNPSVTVECYEPNTNSSSPPPPTTTTTTKSTTTQVTTTQKLTSTVVTANAVSTPRKSTDSNSGQSSEASSGSSAPIPSSASAEQTPAGQTTLYSTTDGKGSPSSGVTGGTGQSTVASTPGEGSGKTDTVTGGDEDKKFPVAAVVGGVAGGLVLLLIIVVAVMCSRKKQKKKPPPLENGTEEANHEHSYLNHSYEDREPQMVDNMLYVSSGYHDPHLADQQKPVTDDDTDRPQISAPVVSNQPPDDGLYASPDDLPQDTQSTVLDHTSSNIPDHYASVDTENARVPERVGPTDSQEVTVSPSGDIYAVVNKSLKAASPNSVDVSADDDLSEPLHEVSPSGDKYAIVDKTNQPMVSSEADDIPPTAGDSESHHSEGSVKPDGSGDLYYIADNGNQPNVSSGKDDYSHSFEDPEVEVHLDGEESSRSHHATDDEEAALNMVNTASNENVKTDENNGENDGENDTPIIQSTDL